MIQSNYILKYKGPGQDAADDLKLIRSSNGLKILDDSAFPKMLLVSAHSEIMNQLKNSLLNWLVLPENAIPLPSTKKQLKRNIGLPSKKVSRW
jgi:hypothetical protein